MVTVLGQLAIPRGRKETWFFPDSQYSKKARWGMLQVEKERLKGLWCSWVAVWEAQIPCYIHVESHVELPGSSTSPSASDLTSCWYIADDGLVVWVHATHAGVLNLRYRLLASAWTSPGCCRYLGNELVGGRSLSLWLSDYKMKIIFLKKNEKSNTISS